MDKTNYLILAVDDEPIVHSMLARIIGDSELPVALGGTAESGREALLLAETLQPSICLLDINMDGMNGLELAERLFETLGYRPRVIFLTAYDYFNYAREAIRVGAMDYILKPIIPEELLAALGKAVNQLQVERIQQMEHDRLEEHLKSLVPALAPSGKTPTGTHRSAIVRKARRYVEEHYSERISLTTVADHLCLSPGYLGSIFKSDCGIPFRSYLRRVRIAAAKNLMGDPTLNLTEVARAVGYDDLNYFSQVFLAEAGIRPSEYRGEGRMWAK